MLKSRYLLAAAMTALVVMSASSQAGTMLDTSGDYFTIGSSWQLTGNDNNGTLYASFDHLGLAGAPDRDGAGANLAVNASYDFTFGSINLTDPGITQGESGAGKDYSVTANLIFVSPLGVGTQADITTLASAVKGTAQNTYGTLTLHFDPVFVAFGNNGEFEIQLGSAPNGTGDFIWTATGSKNVYAHITLLHESVPTTSPVPEPSSLALLGCGGLAFGAYRRRRSKMKQTI